MLLNNEEKKILEEKVRQELSKYNIDLDDNGFHNRNYEFQGAIQGYKRYLRLFCGFSMGRYFHVSLGNGEQSLVTPIEIEIEKISNVESFCEKVASVVDELDKRSKVMTEEFKAC